MKNTMDFLIKIHSFVDIITNSSTEMFALDDNKSVSVIQDLIRAKEDECNSHYHAFVRKSDEYDLEDIFGYIDIEHSIEILTKRGYTIIPPKEETNKNYIIISGERGCIDPKVVDFINTTFNVIAHDN